MRMRLKITTNAAPVLAALVTIACTACGDSDDTKPADVTPVLENYAANLYSAYADATTDAQTLATQVETFLANPTEATLADTRTAWLASREHYMLTEGARFYDGPIDIDPPNHEAEINAWPLDEAYIDYTSAPDGAMAGFVNHPELMANITIDAVDAANAQGGDMNISDGYHAIEFLLWGQALTDVGPGQRPATDYVVDGGRANADRRGTYLRVATQGVIQHLTAVRDSWAPGADYRTQFVAGGLDSVALIFTGLGRMSKGELAGQRMNAPYASKSRRDQHDCFSSDTLVDYSRDALGLQQMYMGNYGTNSGPSLSSLVAKADAELDSRIEQQLAQSVALMNAIPAPFEASIAGDDSSPGRVAILATINSLEAQGDMFADAAAALGRSIVVPDDNG